MNKQPRLSAILRILLFLLNVPLLSVTVHGQAQCGFAETISYPIDAGTFRMTQGFAVPSERHHGRFHTGEDWYGGRGMSYGQPVRAIAAGRVTYAYAIGWGRDGGVVIIEHTFPDGAIAYSQYGHMIETDTVQFPRGFECVQAGQVIGVVGDARPAPHLHFEIRVNNPDVPGPGYTWEDPVTLGWRSPAKFITNRQAWLHPAYQWHIEAGGEAGPIAPPLALNDGSLLYLDGDMLKRATYDGRVLWRIVLEHRAVDVSGYRGTPLLTYADGTVQVINLDGTLGESWQTDISPDGPPLFAGEAPVFHTSDNALVMLDETRRGVIWRLEGVPEYVRGYVAGDSDNFTVGLITAENEIRTISWTGELLYRGWLRETGSFATAEDGSLLAYTRGGLWRIDSSGTWSLVMENAPPGGGSSAALVTDAGRMYLFDGETMHAYSRDGELLWQSAVPDVSGLAELVLYGNVLLLTSNHGDIAALRESGGLCGQTKIFGDDRARLWYELGGDGVLRVAVADQIMGLDWRRFTGACG